MIPFAHAGHVLLDMLYAAPLLIMVGLLVVGKMRDRRREMRLEAPRAGYLRRTMTAAQVHDELFTVWSAARAEANLAYAAWCDMPGPGRTPSIAPPRIAPTPPSRRSRPR